MIRAAAAALATGAAATALAAWALHWSPAGWLVLALALSLSLSLLAWMAWHQTASGTLTLHFDGAVWWLAPAGGAPIACRAVEVVFDFDTWLLLRAHAGRWRYLPLARHRLGTEWGRLRATLYSARPETPPDGR